MTWLGMIFKTRRDGRGPEIHNSSKRLFLLGFVRRNIRNTVHLEISLSSAIRSNDRRVAYGGKTIDSFYFNPLIFRMARNAAGESYINASESEL